MGAAELSRWELLESIDPWGQRRDDYRAAVICWTIASCMTTRAPSFERILAQFDFDRRDRQQSDDEMERIFQVIARRK